MIRARILVVEDSRVVAQDIRLQLGRIGHTVVGVTASGEDAVGMAGDLAPDIVLMDIRIEGAIDGTEAARRIRELYDIPVIYLTAYADDDTLRRATVTEPYGYLLKPFEELHLRTAVEMALFRHAAERRLRDSERRYAVTLSSIGDAVIATDERLQVTFLNPVASALTGWPVWEALGRPLPEVFRIINEDTGVAVEDPAARVLRLGTMVGLANHTALVARDGRVVPIDDCGSPIVDDRGRITGVVLVFRDVTQRRRAEEAEQKRVDAGLRTAKAAAESANRAKDEFLANVSHEIRTPMNAILGLTELVLDTSLGDDQRQLLKIVESAARSLLRIISDLLDFSEIEAGKLELDVGDLRLRAALGETLRALATRAHRKGLELICDVDPAVPDALVGDAGRLRQVIINLVGNAIKFTPAGEVDVRVELDAGSGVAAAVAGEGEVCLRFSVRDTGIGVPREKQAAIFRAFEQEDTSTTRKYGGTGLGLTISARLIALMGGHLTVESEPGRGSTFAFTARFGRTAAAPEAVSASPPPVLRGLHALVVEDNAVGRRLLEGWLRGWGAATTAVGDGVAAIDALMHGVATGRPFELMVLDAGLHDTDGLTLAARIRRRAELAATRIIFLTSGERPGDLARLRDLRIEAHLTKPVLQDELRATIVDAMGRAVGELPAAPAPSPPRPAAPALRPGDRLHILVAEDNEFNSRLIAELLTRRGHHVRLAGDGNEALRLLDGEAFDLMLLDLHMPEMDGFQVIQAIRERERVNGGHLPVIAVTARARPADRERVLAAGMDGFLVKPLDAAGLWAAIDGALASPRATRTLLDPAALLAACDEDDAILAKICSVLRARLPADMAAIDHALRDGDAHRLREAAHKLAGMVAAFSTSAGRVASDLEDRAARGDLDGAGVLVAELHRMAAELVRLVEGLSIVGLRAARTVRPPT